MKSVRFLLLFAALASSAGLAEAKSIFVPIVSRTASLNVENVTVPDSLVISGQVPIGTAGSITHTVIFKAPAPTLRGTIHWNLLNKTRLVGVNVDLIDNTTNTVAATDAFVGVLGRIATSSLDASGLIAGRPYRLVFTGTQITSAVYTIALEFGPLPP